MISKTKTSLARIKPPLTDLLGLIGGVALLTTAAHADTEQPECEVLVIETPATIPLPYGCHTLGAAIDWTVDSDAFGFTAEANDSLRIIVDQISNNCMGIRVDVFGPDGFISLTAETQPSCYYGDVSHSLILPFTVVIPGDYVVLVSDSGNDQAGQYTLQIERIFPDGPAPALGYGINQSTVIAPTTDHDAYSFFGLAGGLVRINVDQTSDNCMGVHLEVFDPTGAPILDEACQPSCYYGDVSCSFFRDLSLGLTGNYLIVLSDPGVDQEGSLNVSVNCILGCPQLASSVQRNGSGVNPLVYDSVCPPVLGGTWQGQVDTTGHPGAAGTVLFTFLRPLNPGVPFLNFGELLVDRASAPVGRFLKAPIDAAGVSSYSIPLPRNAALAGLHLSSQAAILGGLGAELTNAVDLVLGY